MLIEISPLPLRGRGLFQTLFGWSAKSVKPVPGKWVDCIVFRSLLIPGLRHPNFLGI